MVKNKIIANFTGVSIFILVSKALGFLRDIMIAASIGTSRLADVYLQIFGIPSLLFTSIGMALSSVNIPTLTFIIANKSEDEKKRYVSNLLNQVTVFATVICLLGIVFAPVFTKLILPFVDNETAGIAITLTRIMFPTLLFISLAYITAGILQVYKHFFITALLSVPANILIITSLIIWREDVVMLGYVTTAGWMLQFLVQLPVLLREKHKFQRVIDLNNEYTRTIYRQLIPILLGNAVLQICLITDRAFATNLGEGSASALSYGSNLFTTITSIFIVAMSTVTFPDLSRYCMEREYEKVRHLLNYIFKVLFFILVPYLIIVTVFSSEIIGLVYKRGAFTDKSAIMTSEAFLLYSFCIAGYVSQEIFNRVYYALKKYRIPMVSSLICISMNFVIVLGSYKYFGIVGIAGATAVSLMIYAIIMNLMVSREIGAFVNRDFIRYLLKLLLPCSCMLIIFLIFRSFASDGILKTFLLPLGIGGAVYLVVAYLNGIIRQIIVRRT